MPLKLNAADGTSVQLSAPSLSANNNLNLPIGNGISGQAILTDGLGNLSWGAPLQVSNTLTFDTSGAGAAPGTGFSGSSPVTISYNTIGAANTTGTNAIGTWPIAITGNAGTATTLSGGSVSATTGSFSGSATFSTGSTSLPSITFSTGASTGLYSPSANIIGLVTSGTESLRVDTLGNTLIKRTVATGTTNQPLQVTGGAYISNNVGIGVTNPTQSLHVSGNFRLTGSLYDLNNGTGTTRQFLTSTGTGTSWFTIPTLTFGTYLTGTSYNGTSAVTIGIAATSVNTANNIIARDSAGSFNATDGAFTGQLSSTQANDATTGGGQIYLNGANGNRIDFNGNGIAAPAFNTRSAGTKIVLYPNVGAASVDFALGIANATFWQSVDTTASSFKWYGGTTLAATLTGAGALTTTGTISAPTLTSTGQITSTQANSTTTGGGQIYLNGANGNRIDFSTAGVAAPAFNTRSAGTKIVLYPNLGAASVDFALGIDNATFWQSIDASSSSFKWYAGTTNIATLSGAGALSTTSSITGTTLISTGTTGTAPLNVSSSTQVTNLNAQYHNGLLSSSSNTVSTIVARDASGNFSAGTITANLTGTATTASQVSNTLTFGTYLTGGSYNGSSAITIGIAATSVSTGNSVVVRDASGNFASNVITHGAGTTALPSINFSTGTSTGIYSPSANVLAISTGSTERLRIDNSGNVGIGTTTPSQKLHVVGNSYITGAVYDSNNSAGSSGLFLQSTGTGTSWAVANRMFLETSKAGSGTSVDFTTIPSWAKKITVMFNGISLSGTALILIQLGTAGSGISTAGYSSSCGTAGGSTYNNATNGFLITASSAASDIWNGATTITSFGSNIWICSGVVARYATNSAANGGSMTLNGTLDRLKITTTGSDTFDAGSVNVLYEGY